MTVTARALKEWEEVTKRRRLHSAITDFATRWAPDDPAQAMWFHANLHLLSREIHLDMLGEAVRAGVAIREPEE